ncbi:MAG: AraC family transcriptional regulator [Phycisphaeraceae bacterium]|nr:AraC family transcriptional regulator [Phycisphaeraceae bacterium]
MGKLRSTAIGQLEKMLVLHSRGHFANQPNHRSHRPDPADCLLIWVLGGRGFAETQGVRAEATAGHLLTFLPGESQTYGSDQGQPWEIMWVHFGGNQAVRYLHALRENNQPFARLGLNATLRDQFEELLSAESHLPVSPMEQTVGPDILAGHMLGSLLGRMIHLMGSRDHRPSVAGSGQLNVTQLRRYIYRHLTEQVSLEQLAQMSHLSVTHFSRLFRKQFGTSPMHYVIQQRMVQAATLLTETSSPIKQVADAVGYDDAYYFSRLFKRIVGITPSQYRQEHRSTS